MQSSMQTFKPAAISRSVTARAGRRAAAPVVRCQGLPSAIKEAGKVAAAAALAVSLVLVSREGAGCRTANCVVGRPHHVHRWGAGSIALSGGALPALSMNVCMHACMGLLLYQSECCRVKRCDLPT